MKCPHCSVEVNENFTEMYIGPDAQFHWSVLTMVCPAEKCKKIIVALRSGDPRIDRGFHTIGVSAKKQFTVYPLTANRSPVPTEVTATFAEDYNEACLILNFSAKASAALSRRCLQNILREKGGVKHSDLSKEIQEAIDAGNLPSHLIESIDAIRNIGNFAAHPIKSKSTGEVVPVEPGEAEWLLDVLEALFDFYFVQPAILKSKKDALNKKLIDAGKNPMK